MNHKIHPRCLQIVAIICFIGLILGIAGVSSADDNEGTYHAGAIVQASMGIFIAVFIAIAVLTVWLFVQLRPAMRVFQKKLFLAITLSCPLLVIRLVYSAISDYADNRRFAVLEGDPTIYLCMNVLEEIVAMGLTMVLGVSAVRAEDFVQATVAEQKGGEV
jgi:hypothetical protein